MEKCENEKCPACETRKMLFYSNYWESEKVKESDNYKIAEKQLFESNGDDFAKWIEDFYKFLNTEIEKVEEFFEELDKLRICRVICQRIIDKQIQDQVNNKKIADT